MFWRAPEDQASGSPPPTTSPEPAPQTAPDPAKQAQDEAAAEDAARKASIDTELKRAQAEVAKAFGEDHGGGPRRDPATGKFLPKDAEPDTGESAPDSAPAEPAEPDKPALAPELLDAAKKRWGLTDEELKGAKSTDELLALGRAKDSTSEEQALKALGLNRNQWEIIQKALSDEPDDDPPQPRKQPEAATADESGADVPFEIDEDSLDPKTVAGLKGLYAKLQKLEAGAKELAALKAEVAQFKKAQQQQSAAAEEAQFAEKLESLMDRGLSKVPGLSDYFGSFTELRRAAAVDPTIEKWKHLQFFKGDFQEKYEKYAQLLMPPLSPGQRPTQAHWSAYERAVEMAAKDAWAGSLLNKLAVSGNGRNNGSGGNGTGIFGKEGRRTHVPEPTPTTSNDNKAELARVAEVARRAFADAGGNPFGNPHA